jgi:hypothetical protein
MDEPKEASATVDYPEGYDWCGNTWAVEPAMTD